MAKSLAPPAGREKFATACGYELRDEQSSEDEVTNCFSSHPFRSMPSVKAKFKIKSNENSAVDPSGNHDLSVQTPRTRSDGKIRKMSFEIR